MSKYTYNYQGKLIQGYDIIYNNTAIGRLSNAFVKKLESNLTQGYEIKNLEIEYVAKWFEKKQEILCDIFLCRITIIQK